MFMKIKSRMGALILAINISIAFLISVTTAHAQSQADAAKAGAQAGLRTVIAIQESSSIGDFADKLPELYLTTWASGIGAEDLVTKIFHPNEEKSINYSKIGTIFSDVLKEETRKLALKTTDEKLVSIHNSVADLHRKWFTPDQDKQVLAYLLEDHYKDLNMVVIPALVPYMCNSNVELKANQRSGQAWKDCQTGRKLHIAYDRWGSAVTLKLSIISLLLQNKDPEVTHQFDWDSLKREADRHIAINRAYEGTAVRTRFIDCASNSAVYDYYAKPSDQSHEPKLTSDYNINEHCQAMRTHMKNMIVDGDISRDNLRCSHGLVNILTDSRPKNSGWYLLKVDSGKTCRETEDIWLNTMISIYNDAEKNRQLQKSLDRGWWKLSTMAKNHIDVKNFE